MLAKLRSLILVFRLARIWWSEPIDRSGQVAYFAQHGVLGAVQLAIGACTAFVGVIPLLNFHSPAGPASATSMAISLGFAATTIPWVAMWWFGSWPPRWCSIAFITYADIGIAVVALQDADRRVGLLGVMTMALISVYVEFFEGPRILLLHIGWMLLTVGIFAVLIGTGPHGDPRLAIAKAVVSVVSLVATPLIIQSGIWLLRRDSMSDQLTGCLNRRGLRLLTTDLVRDPNHPAGAHVMVAVIDLDRFKAINDTYGHAEGDAVLVRSSSRIKSAIRGSAIVGRTGGEEFVVIDVAGRRDILRIAERLRVVIAAPADRAAVTASIGVVSVALDDVLRLEPELATVLETAVRHADEAMFDAKAGGGNAIAHTQLRFDDHSQQLTVHREDGQGRSAAPAHA